MVVAEELMRERIMRLDGYLEPHIPIIEARYKHYCKVKHSLGDLSDFTAPGQRGFSLQDDNSIIYREWAPGAHAAFLIGDFNDWNRKSHPMKKEEQSGVWSIVLAPSSDGSAVIKHGSRVKISLGVSSGENEGQCFMFVDRVPAWIKYAKPYRSEDHKNVLFEGIFWNPQKEYVWQNQPVPFNAIFFESEDHLRDSNVKEKSSRSINEARNPIFIYECHVGISSEEGKISSYQEFAQNMIPRIAKQGYTAIQLMAVMEHAYYASFGYQVTSFHAASSHFGTPDDLRNLIDTAHGAGLSVLIDVVHSHASKNVLDGLNCFDGTEYQYFHSGSRGTHPMWDSRLFDYGKTEVLRFLLSNLRMWVEDYKIDGFRFDGVTSMLYHHHGTFVGFSGHYDEYFQGGAVDGDALVYLQLANEMLHTLWCKNDNQENFKSTIDNLGLEYKLSQAKGLFDRPTSNTNGIHFNSKQIVEVGEKIGEPNFFGIKCDEKNAIHFNQNSESRSLEKAREEGSFQRRRILTIAEDVSGMPLLCRPTNTEGGIGFDMRLGMGVPDMWIRLMKIPDEQWILGSILHTLCDRRPGEATISYAESHDQALVGDKTLAHWLIDGDIYTEMSLDRPANIRVDRGIALHKLVRLMSIFLGGEHYLCFEGNEFGHPEWLDFPREGNNWSFHHARRQFSLGDNPNLRYSHLAAFDSEMLYARSLMTSMCGFIQPNITYLSEDEKIFIAEYGASYLLLINLHPTSSRPNLEFSVPKGGKYLVVLDSDAMKFGGHARVDSKMTYHTIHDSKTNRDNLHIYLPSRTGIVLERSSHSAE